MLIFLWVLKPFKWAWCSLGKDGFTMFCLWNPFKTPLEKMHKKRKVVLEKDFWDSSFSFVLKMTSCFLQWHHVQCLWMPHGADGATCRPPVCRHHSQTPANTQVYRSHLNTTRRGQTASGPSPSQMRRKWIMSTALCEFLPAAVWTSEICSSESDVTTAGQTRTLCNFIRFVSLSLSVLPKCCLVFDQYQ